MSQPTPLRHLAIIPDGNTRWAKARGLPVFAGYKAGAERGLEIFEYAQELGIKTLTFWGLSTENWRHRPKRELDFLVRLFVDLVDRYIEKARRKGVRIVHLGSKANLPKRLIDKLAEAEQATAGNSDYYFNIALDYGGHDEILRAVQGIISDVSAGKLNQEDLSKTVSTSEAGIPLTVLANYLDTKNQPYPFPDFVIRTSGEIRLSGFMPWQSVYSELYFEPDFWPDFTRAKLDAAIVEYNRRQRRFGGGHNDQNE